MNRDLFFKKRKKNGDSQIWKDVKISNIHGTGLTKKEKKEWGKKFLNL